MGNILYDNNHNLLRIDEDKALVGLTEEALESLSGLVEITLPMVGDELEMGYESGASLSLRNDIFEVLAPLSGRITRVNSLLKDDCKLIFSNSEDSWIFEMEIDDSSELDDLLEYDEYLEYLGTDY